MNYCTYIMQDQVRDLVPSLMAPIRRRQRLVRGSLSLLFLSGLLSFLL